MPIMLSRTKLLDLKNLLFHCYSLKSDLQKKKKKGALRISIFLQLNDFVVNLFFSREDHITAIPDT